MQLTIKQAAEKIGVSVDTLRYYDKEGIVSPKRHENGYRQYDNDDIAILKNIIVMKYAHFSIAEMKRMEEVFTREPDGNCNDICKDILNTKIFELKQAVCNYQKIITLMEKLLPMIDSTEAYLCNAERIDAFIGQIFEDIRSDSLFSLATSPASNGNEVE